MLGEEGGEGGQPPPQLCFMDVYVTGERILKIGVGTKKSHALESINLNYAFGYRKSLSYDSGHCSHSDHLHHKK